MTMRDYDVRIALRRRLDIEHAGDGSTRVVEELGLCETVRVDFAVINGSLTGFELKSERDTLLRLPKQAATYSRVFDYVHLVSAQNHIDHARKVIPRWWGILIATANSSSEVSLRTARAGKRNPAVDPAAIVQLLWREEALAILTRFGADRGVRSKPREFVWDRLVESVSVPTLQAEVRDVLKARRGWRENAERHENVATSRLADTTPRFLARRLR